MTFTFTPNDSFSSVHFDLAVHTHSTRKIGFTFNQLFKVEKLPFVENLKFVCSSRSHPWPSRIDLTVKPSEKEVVLRLASEILVPLCTEVLLEKRYRMDISKMPLKPGLMLIGQHWPRIPQDVARLPRPSSEGN